MKKGAVKTAGVLAAACLIWIAGALAPSGYAAAKSSACSNSEDDTMLMFVGMDLEVLSIASRREESASQAPAIARVITRKQIESSGYSTLSEVLSMTPGFYMAPREWGSMPYLRGIQNSALFLYDTVPLHSNIDKSVNPLGYELSLAPVKRIEIIRGPGSVLWGPDAYGGIVNIVPLEGKDIKGAETGAVYNSVGENQAGGYVNAGGSRGPWDLFVSASARYGREDDRGVNLVSFWSGEEGPVPPGERYGSSEPDAAKYLDFVGRLSYNSLFSVTGRFSDFEKPYSVSAGSRDTWEESRSTPFSFVKAEGRFDLDSNSAVRVMGYWNASESEYEVVDKSHSPEQSTYYGEMIYDRRFLSGQGLFTGGLSYRSRDVYDAPVWDSYVPDYLSDPENLSFLPDVKQADYDNDLLSFFGQYSHKIGRMDVFLGARFDDHDSYSDRFSFNLGFVWPFCRSWQLKMLYGTAYRTPFAKQVKKDQDSDPEEINTFNAKLSWSPSRALTLEAGGFISRISDHVMQDPYAGLSDTNEQTVKGLELGCELSPLDALTISANATFLNNSGSDESYRHLLYSYIRPDGTREEVYENIRFPYDPGPDAYGNLMVEWKPWKRVSIFSRLSYADEYRLIAWRERESMLEEGDDRWNLDISALVRDIAGTGTDLSISVRNVLDREEDVPGMYEMISVDDAEVEVMLRKSWN